jgi:hypothetical protein
MGAVTFRRAITSLLAIPASHSATGLGCGVWKHRATDANDYAMLGTAPVTPWNGFNTEGP